jgi:hypothetical protein
MCVKLDEIVVVVGLVVVPEVGGSKRRFRQAELDTFKPSLDVHFMYHAADFIPQAVQSLVGLVLEEVLDSVAGQHVVCGVRRRNIGIFPSWRGSFHNGDLVTDPFGKEKSKCHSRSYA